MADWGILKNSGKDFLSSLAYDNDDSKLSQFVMSKYLDGSYNTSQSVYDENSFCTPDNIDMCISHLNAELTGLGFQPVSRDGIGHTTSLINALDSILRLYQKSGRVKEELENRLHRVNSDVSENQSMIRKLKTEKERVERDEAQEKEKHRQTHNKIKTLTTRLKTEKDELRKSQAILKARDVQYKHELKKKQREVNKLMEKLHQVLMDKNPDHRIGMDMVGFLHRGENKRSKWKNAALSDKQEEMYQLLISNYEGKQQELRVENTDLRDCLVDMQRELASLCETTDHTISDLQSKNGVLSASSSETDLSAASSLSCELSDDMFQMPYDMLRDNLQKSFHDTCKKIKDNIKKCSVSSSCSSTKQATRKSSSPSKSPSNHVDANRESERRGEEMEKLKKQIEKYKTIVQQQEELIQQSLHTQSRSMENSFLQESQILQEKESLSEQRRKFYQEKANFEEEKRSFTESAIQLQQERKMLESEKSSMFKSQFLQISPYGSKPPAGLRSGEKTRLLPSTPIFSPAPGKNKPPSPSEVLLGSSKKHMTPKDKSSIKKRLLPKSGSLESDTSSCFSAHSAPGDLAYSSSSSRGLSFDDLEEFEKTLTLQSRQSSCNTSVSSRDKD